MLSTSIALLPEPETQVVMWPPPPAGWNTIISPAVTIDCQLPVCPAGPSKATIHSPFDWPGRPISVLCTGTPAPASAAILLASTQHPSMFHAWPTKLSAAATIESGVAWVGTAPVSWGWVATVALPI
jgi:hypothetical protein